VHKQSKDMQIKKAVLLIYNMYSYTGNCTMYSNSKFLHTSEGRLVSG